MILTAEALTARMIEPQGLLHGAQAAQAVAAGHALPLMGGQTAFTRAILIEGSSRRAVFSPDIPETWADVRTRVTTAAPDAGLAPDAMVMGILNATPDSFSDGGRHLDPVMAVEAGLEMHRAGAAVIDIGGESTRPGAPALSAEAEWDRIGPVIAGLRARSDAILSIDTRNAPVMERALRAGAHIINDVSALAHDPDAASVLADHDCAVALMHMRGTPETMNDLTDYTDVATDMVRELAARMEGAVRAGIAPGRIIVDPGIGFAKTAAQNFALLARLPILANLGCRVLLGTSRKRFIGAASAVTVPQDRDPGTLVTTLPGLDLPGTLLRVHAVSQMVQAVRVWQAMQA